MVPTLGNGKICYLELPTRDVRESAAFYHNVFGWEMRTRGDGAIAFDDAVGEVSGAFTTRRKAVADVGLLVYVMVFDMEATLRLVIENGGEIVQPVGEDLPEITARIKDKTGNILGLYQEPVAQQPNGK